MPSPSTTPTLDPTGVMNQLPSDVQSLFNRVFSNQPPAAAPAAPMGGLQEGGNVGMDNQIPGYAEGGLVQEGGVPPVDTGIGGGPGLATGEQQGAAPQGDVNLEQQAKQLLKQQPQLAQELVQTIQDQMEMGDTTEDEIIKAGKMAIVVARNPDMYPKMVERLTAIGVEDVPPQFDPEFILTLILMFLAWQQKGSGGMDSGTGGDEIPSFAMGGLVTHGSKGETGPVVGAGGSKQDLVTARLSDGEYVMTADAAKYFGTDKFDKMNKIAAEKMKLQKGA